ncbi:MAG: hypothetical protein JW727_00095 [Candidatus Aenigmarchaeota archaeon]|nr:hypothetical protein [Candidatus Aenigmarchaeota archaeon]
MKSTKSKSKLGINPVIGAAAVVLLIAVLVLGASAKVQETTYPLKANVTELRLNDSKILIGVSNDADQLDFGVVSVNMSVQKELDIRNFEKVPAKVIISRSGNIAPMVSVSESSIVLSGGETRKVFIEFNATEKGEYSGVLTMVVRTPKYAILAPLSLWK